MNWVNYVGQKPFVSFTKSEHWHVKVTGLTGLDPVGSDPLGFFGKKNHLKKPTILSTFGFFQFNKIFATKADKNKISAYAI